MRKNKDGSIHFDNYKDLNIFFNEKFSKKILETKQEVTKEALLLILPISCTALYEAYGFADVRQTKFVELFLKHIDCINEGVTNIEQYEEFCKQQGYKYFDIEVEVVESESKDN